MIPTTKIRGVSDMYIDMKLKKLTRRYRISIFLHEQVILLEVVLERVKTPQRFFVQLLAFVRTCDQIQEFFPSSCSTLQSHDINTNINKKVK